MTESLLTVEVEDHSAVDVAGGERVALLGS